MSITQTARILLVSRNKFLLVRERPDNRNPYGVWKLPGGMIHWPTDRSLEETAIREVVHEEVQGLEGIITENMLDLMWKKELPSTRSGVWKRFLNVFPLIISRSVPVSLNPKSPEILGVTWASFSRPPSKKDPVQGALLSLGMWGDLVEMLTDPEIARYFEGHGYNKKRRDGLIRSWEGLSDHHLKHKIPA